MPIALNMFASVGMGLLLGLLGVALVRPPPELRRHVLAASALGNAGNLPLVLVAALVKESGGRLFKGQVISEDLAIAYVAIGIWAATLTHFTLGSFLLKLPAGHEQEQEAEGRGGPQLGAGPGAPGGGAASSGGALPGRPHGVQHGSCGSCVVELGVVPPTHARGQQQQQQQQQHDEPPRDLGAGSLAGSSASLRSHSSADCLVIASSVPQHVMSGNLCCCYCGARVARQQQGLEGGAWSCPSCGAAAAVAGGKAHADEEQEQQWQHASVAAVASEQARLLGSQRADSSGSSWQQLSSSAGGDTRGSSSSNVRRWSRAAGAVAWELLQQLSSPPMIGCMLAVAVGVTRPLQDQLFEPGGHLLMLQDCISMFGACCIPCLLLMLGATLAKGPGKARVPARVILVVAVARLVVLPLVGTAWLLAAKATGWVAAPDPMFILVMLIQNAVPTALNVHTLATLHGNREAEMGAMLFWQYLGACVTLPAALSAYLWLLGTPAMAVGAG